MRNRLAAQLIAVLILGAAASAVAQEPTAPVLEYAFDLTVHLGQAVPVGETALGGRNIVPITGGMVVGPSIHGEIVPGGWDWQLVRQDGCIQIRADYMLKTDDNVLINIVDTGINCLPACCGTVPPRTQPIFEAPRDKYDWLNRAAFVGAAERFSDAGGSGLKIRVYRVR